MTNDNADEIARAGAADSVVVALGSVPDATPVRELSACGVPIQAVGDCARIG